ncbi:MAG TPA: CRISPR-associated helicase Cas3' [Arachnia sp.]|nr:CRISPR-associated helicase Cas3' [Arachnia sp.]HMT86553.1 CRISPR-associated helicase Cas3' [Arachnia sp.]
MVNWAHSRNVAGERHSLADHLRGTAALARTFAEPFGAGDLAYGAGLLHDAGKVCIEWQRYLLARENNTWRGRKIPHKETGAYLYGAVAKSPGVLAILGHHGGIPDWVPGATFTDLNPPSPETIEALLSIVPEAAQFLEGPARVPSTWKSDRSLDLRVRMLHSALVDADWLDTAAHFNATEVSLTPAADFEAALDRFLAARAALLTTRTASPLDDARGNLFDDCLEASALPPGIFRLPAPTGSGKTMSAAAFALAHAAHNNLRRVIVAVPFLTITEQNAAVYRRLLGSDFVVEHHSGAHHEEGTLRSRSGVENWDAPFIMTTTVQLFESLLSNRPSRTRKLHRLVRSVIVLDELQAVPVHVLPVVLDVLQRLVNDFGATVLLASATQPAWDDLDAWRHEKTDAQIHEIVAKPAEFYAQFQRSRFDWRHFSTRADLVSEVARQTSALVVVNTTRDARTIAQELSQDVDAEVLHLSTRMYPAHRRSVLRRLRELQETDSPVFLVSTQLVEAGVDLDFPVVFRAVAPAENLIQAQGRCNREGHRPDGRTIIVDCPELGRLREYDTSIAVTRRNFEHDASLLADPRVVDDYYRDLYKTLGVDGLKEAESINDARARLQMATVSRDFKMIKDSGISVVVGDAEEAAALLDNLHQRIVGGHAVTPAELRPLREYAATLPERYAQSAYLTQHASGVLVSVGCYNWLTGLNPDDETPHDSIW